MKKIPLYGESLLHLLGVLICYALVTYASIKLFGVVSLWIALAFPAGVIVHDFILFPVYRKVDQWLSAYQEKQQENGTDSIRWINYVRFPLMTSLLLFFCYFPLILRLPEDRHLDTGLSPEPYLYRWLIVSGTLMAGAIITYYIRSRQAGNKERSA